MTKTILEVIIFGVKVTIVLPTYNERENIRRLLPELLIQFKRLAYDLQILVVDDNSPDGTAREVRRFIDSSIPKEKNPIILLTGKKQGLGAAYIRGFKYALKKLKPDCLVEMDADFSHQPYQIPQLLERIESGADFVIGSRYVRGGKVSAGWGILRTANSLWGNRFARYLAGIDNVRDCTSGFRAIKREVLEKFDLDKLKVRGYSFQMNLLYKAYVSGAKIKEVPIDFRERRWGETKLGTGDIFEFMWNSLKLRFEKGFNGLDKRALRATAKKNLDDTPHTASA